MDTEEIFRNRYTSSLITAFSSAMPSSMISISVVNGGRKRITLARVPQDSRINPFSAALAQMALVRSESGFFISPCLTNYSAIMAPRLRMSPTIAGCSALISRRWLTMRSPIASARSHSFSSSMASNTAKPAAQPNGEPA